MTLADRSAALYPCLTSSDRKTAVVVKVPPAAANWTTFLFRFLSKILVGFPGVLKPLRNASLMVVRGHCGHLHAGLRPKKLKRIRTRNRVTESWGGESVPLEFSGSTIFF
jgi:hypothetical protein